MDTELAKDAVREFAQGVRQLQRAIVHCRGSFSKVCRLFPEASNLCLQEFSKSLSDGVKAEKFMVVECAKTVWNETSSDSKKAVPKPS